MVRSLAQFYYIFIINYLNFKRKSYESRKTILKYVRVLISAPLANTTGVGIRKRSMCLIAILHFNIIRDQQHKI